MSTHIEGQSDSSSNGHTSQRASFSSFEHVSVISPLNEAAEFVQQSPSSQSLRLEPPKDVVNENERAISTMTTSTTATATATATAATAAATATATTTATATPTVPYAAAKSFIAGAVSGAVAKTAVAPFDRTKILMQVSQMYGWDRYRGSVWDAMSTIWRTEGFFGFFRGNSATVARIMPYAAVQYYSFEYYNRTLSEFVFHSDAPHPLKRFTAGAMAGSTSVLCTYPIDLARTVLAVQVSNSTTGKTVRRLNVFSTLHGIIQEQGLTGVYRGVYPTLVGVVPYAGISFLSFGILKRSADRRHVSHHWPILTNLVCGASAGLTAQCCTYPFDIVRRRLQALHKPELMTESERVFLKAATTSNRFFSFSIINAIGFIVRTEGLNGLYRGVSLNFLKTAPAMAISFTCYDKIRTALGVPPGKFSATRG